MQHRTNQIAKIAVTILIAIAYCTTTTHANQIRLNKSLVLAHELDWTSHYSYVNDVFIPAFHSIHSIENLLLSFKNSTQNTSSPTKILSTTYVIDDDGNGNFTTFSAAWASLTAGDVLLITGGADGIHTETGISPSVDVTIRGQGANNTIIQGHATQNTASDRVFIIPLLSTITIENITIRHGKASSDGGGISVANDANLTLNCVIVENNNATSGGGIYHDAGGNGTLTINNSIIRNNTATSVGGGIYSQCDGTTTINGTSIESNSSGTGGGLYMNRTAGAFNYTNCSVTGNTSSGESGGVHLNGGTHTLKNVVIYNNTAASNGGGLNDNEAGNHIDLINCTIAGNTSTSGNGGGIYIRESTGSLDLINNIIADNTASSGNDAFFESGATVTNTTNIVEDCVGATCPSWFSTNDPSLQSATTCYSNLTAIPITSSSNAYNAGTSGGSAPTDDMCGNDRGGSIDIGAFEVRSSIVVDDDGGGDYTTIALAVAAAGNGDIITITGGADNIHTENNITVNKSLTFKGQGQSTTIIQNATTQVSGSTNTIFHLNADIQVVFEDMTMRYGDNYTSEGNCVHANLYSGSSYHRTVTFNHVTITNNNTKAAIYLEGTGNANDKEVSGNGTGYFNDCIFKDSHAQIRVSTADAEFNRCSFSGNNGNNGAAILIFTNLETRGDVFATNCTFYNNTALNGGAIYSSSGDINLVNCTFNNNTGSNAAGAGAVHLADRSSITMTNTIMYGNTGGPSAANDIYIKDNSAPFENDAFGTQSKNIVESAVAENSFTAIPTWFSSNDPLLTTSTCSNGGTIVQIQTGSAAIDAGDASQAPSFDQCKTARSGTFDIGAYELVTGPSTFVVDDDGGGNFTTIAAAVAAAASGDIITINGGADNIHTETAQVTVDKNLTIQGQGQTTTIVQPHGTAGAATHRLFLVNAGYTVTFQDMTMRHGGNTMTGGSILRLDMNSTSSNVSIKNCNFTANGGDRILMALGTYDNTNLDLPSGLLNIHDCVFYDNPNATCVRVEPLDVDIRRCSFYNNGSTATFDDNGAALLIYNNNQRTRADVYIENSTFYNNTTISGRNGGAMALWGADLTLYNCTITGNVSPNNLAGGIWMAKNSAIEEMVNTIVYGNNTNSANDIYIADQAVTADENSISGLSRNVVGQALSVDADVTMPTFWSSSDPKLEASPTTLSSQGKLFKLQSTSIALDNGNSQDAPTDDQTGRSWRDNKTDIGAYENKFESREADSLALLNFYNTTGGPTTWTLKTGYSTPAAVPISGWLGVTMENNRVAQLTINNNELSGTLPDLNLTYLSILNLTNLTSTNKISGSLPDFTSLNNLSQLQLRGHSLSGAIPNFSNLPNLILLDLTSNPVTSISDLTNVPSLVHLYLGACAVNGTIPNFSNLPALQTFHGFNNSIDSVAPQTNIPNIVGFEIYGNQLTFDDIVPHLTLGATTFLYNPQDSTFTDTTITVDANTNLTVNLGIDEGLNTNSYQWYKADGTADGGALTESSRTFSKIQPASAGYYYVQITNSSATATTIYTKVFNIVVNETCTYTDSLALVELYNATSGSSWTNTWNLNNDFDTWHGITTNGSGCVTHINLNNNNLQGEIPVSMNNLINLQSLKLSNNSLTGLAILTPLIGLSLNTLDVDNNQLTFGDINKNITVTNYQYAPQAIVDINRTDTVAYGNAHYLEAQADYDVNNNTYEWFKNGSSVGTSSTNSFLLNNIDASTVGNYTYQITNPTAPLLTLNSNTISMFVVNAGNDTTVCAGSPNFNLTGTPSGGTWAGIGHSGIVDASTGEFSPSIGAGTYLVSYTVGSTTDYVQVTVFSAPSVEAGNDFVVCAGIGNINLSGFTPTGGVWSGAGITDATNGIFNPTAAGGIGTYTLTYTVTNSTTGCSSSDTRNVTVTNGTPVTVGADQNICINDAPVTLTASQTGGVWNGTGVNATTGEFNPAAAGVGTFEVIYLYGVSPCQTSDTLNITVNSVNVDITNNNFTVCNVDNVPVTLNATPAGGNWSGTGINASGTFTPNTLSAGVNKFFYTYTDATTNCAATDSISVTQINCNVFAGLDKTVCITEPTFALSGSPAGGTWSGVGIVDASLGIFDPLVAAIGTFTLTYTVGASSDQVDVTVAALPVVDAIDTVVCNNPVNFVLEATPAGGIWKSGTGLVNGTGLYNTVVGGGVGSNQYAEYEYTDANGCKNIDTALITVVFGDTVNAGVDKFICLSANTLALTDASPAGGAWAGPGVIANTNQIDLAVAGLGIHTYNYTIGTGTCRKTDQLQVSVTNDIQISLADKIETCQNINGLQLPTPSPAGGEWSGDGIVDINIGTFSTNHPAIGNVPGSYFVYYTYDKGTPCEQIDSVEVIINENPLIISNTSFNGDTIEYCVGTEETLTPFFAPIPLNTKVTWSTGLGNTNLIDPSTGRIGIGSAGTGDYIITMTDTITSCNSVDSFIVTVRTTAPPALSASSLAVCQNEEIIFTVSNNLPTLLPDTFVFVRVGNALNGTTLNDTLQIGDNDQLYIDADSNYLNNGDQIRVQKIDAADGCRAMSNVIQVTINSVPQIDLVNNSNNNCLDAPLNFKCEILSTNTPSGSNPYLFFVDGMSQAGLSDEFNTSFNIDTAVLVEVFFTDNNNCEVSDSLWLDIDSLPQIIFTADDTSICIGTAVNFTALSDIGSSTFEYFVNNHSAINTSTYTSSSLVDEDEVTVVVTSPQSCVDSAIIKMVVDTFPVIDIIFNSMDTSSLIDDTLCQKLDVYEVALESNVSGSRVDTVYWSSTTTPSGVVEYDGIFYIDTWTAPEGFNNLTLTAETRNGCVSTDVDSILMKLAPEGPNVAGFLDTTSVCPGDSIDIVVANTNNPANTEYIWSVQGFSSIGFSSAGPYNTDSTFAAPLNVSGASNIAFVRGRAVLDGCRSFIEEDYDLTIIVKSNPLLIQLQDTVFCSGDLINIPAFQSIPQADTVFWYNDNTFVFPAQSGTVGLPQVIGQPSFSQDTTAIITTTAVLDGCYSSDMVFRVTLASVPDTPTVYTPNGRKYCTNGSVVIETEEGAENYAWYNGNTLLSGSDADTLFVYNSGNYTVRALNGQCESAVSNNIFIENEDALELTVDDNGDFIPPYYETFEDGTGGWFTEREQGTDSDWEFGKPDGFLIFEAASGDSAWMTQLTDYHSEFQNSWVISPCFDFSNTAQPAISISLNLDTRLDVNGLVLQYLTGHSGEWVTLGEESELGIEWYTSEDIVAQPGYQGNGWSGTTDGDWLIARYALDELNGEDAVRFRLAFASTDNPFLQDGVAFDNVWLGERYKPVLLEQFTDMNLGGADTTLDLVYTLLEADTNLLSIQYHLNDDIYNQNIADNNARALYYNLISLTEPHTILDGNVFDTTTLLADTLAIVPEDVISHSLEPAVFRMTPIRTTYAGNTMTITTHVNLRDLDKLPLDSLRKAEINKAIQDQKVVIRTAIVEDMVLINGNTDTLHNVLRKMLPSQAGTLYTSANHYSFTWALDNTVNNVANLDVVAFIQHVDTKEVYLVRAGTQTFVPTQHVIPDGEANNMNVFPNPATTYFDVNLDYPIRTNAHWELYDMSGKLVKSGTLPSNIQRFRFDASKIAAGVYTFKIRTDNDNIEPQKLIIVR